jgi:predicted chitinase
MSLVREQHTFLLHVAELIRKAAEMGFVASGGELYRTAEQQAIYIKTGRSKTLDSQHLKRLAVDLNFFRPSPDGSLALTYDVEAIRPLGEFWEGLDPANRWGGHWYNFKDVPHFERREGAARATVAPLPAAMTAAAVAAPSAAGMIGTLAPQATGPVWRGRGLLQATVGPRGTNQRDDVESVQRLLNFCQAAGRVTLPAPLKLDGAFGGKTLAAIMDFQRAVLTATQPDGTVGADSPVLRSLCESLPAAFDGSLLGMIYLRAGDKDLTELAPLIEREMALRLIDTPLRRAHFLAQIGHESGELRFRTEIASGERYEGRLDLGNVQPGDGPRFRGRGLIQLTGRANYAEFGRALGLEADLLADPDRVANDPELCVKAAGWYWARRDLNALADANNLTEITRRINGGLNGLEDRRRLFNRASAML